MLLLTTCTRCANPLASVADPPGVCPQCGVSTAGQSGTRWADPPTRMADLAAVAGTRSFVAGLAVDRVVQTPAREARLAADHGFVEIDRLGRGGMGELYRAWDPAEGRAVVVKFVRPDARTPMNLRRFGTESRSLAKLVHPNVAQLFAAVEGDDPYFVMEYVAGGSVSDWLLFDGPMAPAVAARVLSAAARGVAAANREGVIHRDLKPSNILLSDNTADAIPKVSDFGMAKILGDIEGPTGSRAVLGTPGFLAPEQATQRSAKCDARSDVWGLAATLYCCVTGQPPFDRNAPTDAAATDPLVPAIAVRPDLPLALNAIICKGLEKHPDDRYQTADAFADDLDLFLAGGRVIVTPPGRALRVWRRLRLVPRATAVAVGIAAVALLALGAVALRERPPAAREQTADEIAEQVMDFQRNELLANRPVTFLGEKGRPAWFKNKRGIPTVATSTVDPDVCAISAVGEAWCQLTPELPITDYLLTVELRELDANVLGGQIGAGICADTGLGPDAGHFWPVQLLYSDAMGPRAKGQPARMATARAQVAYDSDLRDAKPVRDVAGIDSVEFRPTRPVSGVGDWRTVTFRVSPAGVTVSWRELGSSGRQETLIGVRTRLQLEKPVTKMMGRVCQLRPSLPLTHHVWSPTGAFLVCVKDATVGVRNLKITPTASAD